MHELSIMTSILEIAQEKAQEKGATRITKIALEIGAKAGVVVEALEFAFDVARQGGLAQDALLEVELVPFRGHCAPCDQVFEARENFLICPSCQEPGSLVSGQELNVKFIEVD